MQRKTGWRETRTFWGGFHKFTIGRGELLQKEERREVQQWEENDLR